MPEIEHVQPTELEWHDRNVAIGTVDVGEDAEAGGTCGADGGNAEQR
jgi:hypothetical protein